MKFKLKVQLVNPFTWFHGGFMLNLWGGVSISRYTTAKLNPYTVWWNIEMRVVVLVVRVKVHLRTCKKWATRPDAEED